jgi:23S rRNA pseudouridine1911/1915/1917 synthase
MELTCTARRSGPLLSFLRTELGLSSSEVKRLKARNAFCLNGTPVHTNCPVAPGDCISVSLSEDPPDFPPEEMHLDILLEDDGLLAVDKPAGLWMHPSASRYTGTLANGVAGYFASTGQCCGIHPVTRLDRDTFGVALLAKNAHIHALLSGFQRERQVKKTYLATVYGCPAEDAGHWELPIARKEPGSMLREVRSDGQWAATDYQVLIRQGDLALLELHPLTGRTHQLRVHCAAAGCPILGDGIYGTEASLIRARELGLETQQLCALALELPHPLTGQVVAIRSNLRPFFPDLPENFPFGC